MTGPGMRVLISSVATHDALAGAVAFALPSSRRTSTLNTVQSNRSPVSVSKSFICPASNSSETRSPAERPHRAGSLHISGLVADAGDDVGFRPQGFD